MSLAGLCLSKGLTLAQAGAALGVDSVLFERVDQGRQGLPMPLVRELAAFLGEQVGTVAYEARVVIPDSNPLVTTQAARTPLPPRPELGDKMPALLLAKPADPPAPSV